MKKIALFDMDGVLVDYVAQLSKDLKRIRSPLEPPIKNVHDRKLPKHVLERIHLIKNNETWWANLPRFKLGWDIYALAKKIGYKVVILSQGPSTGPRAYSGKKLWLEKNLGSETPMILTGDKGMVYGRVLVDDYPVFILRWLKYRPRGFVIMPANSQNKNFNHPRVLRYTGRNLRQARHFLQEAYDVPFVKL